MYSAFQKAPQVSFAQRAGKAGARERRAPRTRRGRHGARAHLVHHDLERHKVPLAPAQRLEDALREDVPQVAERPMQGEAAARRPHNAHAVELGGALALRGLGEDVADRVHGPARDRFGQHGRRREEARVVGPVVLADAAQDLKEGPAARDVRIDRDHLDDDGDDDGREDGDVQARIQRGRVHLLAQRRLEPGGEELADRRLRRAAALGRRVCAGRAGQQRQRPRPQRAGSERWAEARQPARVHRARPAPGHEGERQEEPSRHPRERRFPTFWPKRVRMAPAPTPTCTAESVRQQRLRCRPSAAS